MVKMQMKAQGHLRRMSDLDPAAGLGLLRVRATEASHGTLLWMDVLVAELCLK